ncbi:MAG TPA: PHP domain-containing protein [Thiotrichales bacterium]|nr:PHP domain-containing protein [Thiotrichales bacterium]
MMTRFDLHSHSTASDGTLAPAELVARAARAGVQVLALTDHDTTDGIAEACEAAQRHGLWLVAGVEISVTWKRRTVHIVGLGVDPERPELQAGLQRLREFRQWRAEEIGRRLAKHGIPGAWEGARRLATGAIVGRTHFARFLVENGHAGSVREVFGRFLVKNRPGHVAGRWASLEEAVGWIRAAGGQAVIAHPARYRLTATKLRELIGEFMACGGEALEVVSGSHSRDEVVAMAAKARAFRMLASAGSDYHGPENPWIELGRLPPLPAGCRPVWEGWEQPELREVAVC